MADSIRELMQSDLTAAMKERDRVKVAVLRTTLGAIANAEAVEPPFTSSMPVRDRSVEVDRRELSDADIRAIVNAERADLEESADELNGLGKADEAAELREKAEILAAYLGS